MKAFRCLATLLSLRLQPSKEPFSDSSRVLSEVHNGPDDNTCWLDLVEDAVRKVPNKHAAVPAPIGGCDFRMLAQQGQSRVQLAQEHLSSSGLIILVSVESGLDVVVGPQKQNELGHFREPRIRSLTASHVVNSLGCSRKCSMRRSNSSMISRDTGTSDGLASSSFHSSVTKVSFSEADNRCTSGNFSRIMLSLYQFSALLQQTSTPPEWSLRGRGRVVDSPEPNAETCICPKL